MSYKNTVTVLRVFAIKPIIIIACVIHCFCVFHKKFNGQQFFQEVLHHNFTMTNQAVKLMVTTSNGALNVGCMR